MGIWIIICTPNSQSPITYHCAITTDIAIMSRLMALLTRSIFLESKAIRQSRLQLNSKIKGVKAMPMRKRRRVKKLLLIVGAYKGAAFDHSHLEGWRRIALDGRSRNEIRRSLALPDADYGYNYENHIWIHKNIKTKAIVASKKWLYEPSDTMKKWSAQ